ncbi:MAG: hypothetical protein ACFCU1_02970 [Sumerlaeia bacterium]
MIFSKSPVPEFTPFLEGSAATESFVSALQTFHETGKPDGVIISSNPGAPAVKVARVIQKLLEAHPDWAVAGVNVIGQSGCSDFRGKLHVTLNGGEQKTINFVWDCAWRAQQEGWKSYFGDPDQQRAAREFGYQCFETFNVV